MVNRRLSCASKILKLIVEDLIDDGGDTFGDNDVKRQPGEINSAVR